jgi:multiple sugar transport system permease protein
MIIFLAGLQGVPESLYEAAMIDGAGAWGRFWHVTVPIISPVIFFNLIMGIIGSFQVFTTAFIITYGGGGGTRSYAIGGVLDSLLFYVIYLWQQGFYFHRMGYACAMGWLLLVIILILTIIQFRLQERWVYYEAERRL